MGASSAERVSRIARIHELEMLRQEALHKTEHITRDEEARLLQLRILMIRDENADLRDEVGQRNFKISAMTRDTDQLRLALADSKETIRGQDARLQKQDIDMANLKAELEAFNVTMGDSKKLLQEKFALTRELEHLKPELEHLQSQLTTYQATIAEKNDLRRQLDSLEAELDNEKRLRQRLQSKKNDVATAENHELRQQLESVEAELEKEKRSRQRLQSKNNDAATAENNELRRQLESVKAELENEKRSRQRLQSKNNDAATAENNELRRQLDSVEAELQNEKRSRQRLQSKNNDAALADLASRLEEAEDRLVAERKEHDKIKKGLEKQVIATKDEIERLEERISSLKDKVKGLHDENERLQENTSSLKDKTKGLQAELKEAKEDLHEAKSALAAAQSRPVSRNEEDQQEDKREDKPKKAVTLPADGGRRRRAPVMSFEEITIQTPGNDVVARERPTKKRGTEKVMATVGEKSTFSITPFLNRNKSLIDDSAHEPSRNASVVLSDPEPPMSDEPAAPEPLSESEAEAPRPKASLKTTVTFKSPSKATKPRAVRQTKAATPLGESTPAKANRVVKSRGTPKVKSIPEVRVNKRGSSESLNANPVPPDQENVPVAALKKTASVLEPRISEAGIKKRKRKLLGGANTTFFDAEEDDDGEAVITSKPQPAAAKKTRARLGGGVRNAFAAAASFSPLKRERRGVNASFLA